MAYEFKELMKWQNDSTWKCLLPEVPTSTSNKIFQRNLWQESIFSWSVPEFGTAFLESESPTRSDDAEEDVETAAGCCEKGNHKFSMCIAMHYRYYWGGPWARRPHLLLFVPLPSALVMNTCISYSFFIGPMLSISTCINTFLSPHWHITWKLYLWYHL